MWSFEVFVNFALIRIQVADDVRDDRQLWKRMFVVQSMCGTVRRYFYHVFETFVSKNGFCVKLYGACELVTHRYHYRRFSVPSRNILRTYGFIPNTHTSISKQFKRNDSVECRVKNSTNNTNFTDILSFYHHVWFIVMSNAKRSKTNWQSMELWVGSVNNLSWVVQLEYSEIKFDTDKKNKCWWWDEMYAIWFRFGS